MRGFDEDDFREVGRIICEALAPDADLAALAARSAALCASGARCIPAAARSPRSPGD